MADGSIPSRLNTVLVVAVLAVMGGLLWAAGHAAGWWLAAITVAFSFVFLTAYALMHEASHGSLHADARWNRWLGALLGLLFPTSAMMMRVFHTAHHRCNRTDHEMFDLYYADDRRWLRTANWYAILTGLFWLVIPPAAFVVGFARPLLASRLFRSTRNATRLFDGFDAGSLRQARRECVLLLALWVPLLACGVLDWRTTLLLYAAAAFNWSTRQYVTHAWSPREVMDGSHNLAVSAPMRWILLNGHLDQAHHRFPLASWIDLPRLAADLRPPIPFWRQYLSLWWGPRLAQRPGPEPLLRLVCERT